MYKKKLEDLNLLDDFLFNAMMAHPEVGEKFTQKLLEIIFEKDFPKLRVVPQKTYGGLDTDLHGARLDVYVEEETSLELDAELDAEKNKFVYDLEADQRNNRKKDKIQEFPRRARFYHAIIDSRVLLAGERYSKMKNVFVIFFCDYDPFGYDRIKYTIKNMCVEELGMPYEDGVWTMVLYTKGTRGEVPEKLAQLMQYMAHTTREMAVNETLQEIQKMVETVKHDQEVTVSYMKWFERDEMIREEGWEAGREAGCEAERKNTEAERQRADVAEKKIVELEAELQKYRKQYTDK